MVWLHEPVAAARLVSIALVVAGVVGLQLTSR
jgi:multidrug transporter EmrE-like cation transporter